MNSVEPLDILARFWCKLCEKLDEKFKPMPRCLRQTRARRAPFEAAAINLECTHA